MSDLQDTPWTAEEMNTFRWRKPPERPPVDVPVLMEVDVALRHPMLEIACWNGEDEWSALESSHPDEYVLRWSFIPKE